MFARLLYGFRVSVLFALALTITGTILGVVTGAIQGFFAGKTDLAFQRFIEIWGAMPELYLLIIFSAVFEPSISLLLILLSMFGWMGLSDYVRAEFLRNRQLDYVRAARALGLSNRAIIWRHILPNSMTPVVTFLPFRMSAAILALTSLDFLGLGAEEATRRVARETLDAYSLGSCGPRGFYGTSRLVPRLCSMTRCVTAAMAWHKSITRTCVPSVVKGA